LGLSILTSASLFLADVPNANAGTCTAFSTGWGNNPAGTVSCPAVNPKGIAQGEIGMGNPGDPPTNRQLYVNYYGYGFMIYSQATGWGINSSGSLMSGCATTDDTPDYYAKDYYGCNSAVRVKLTVRWP
jgi:subtilase family serine protease